VLRIEVSADVPGLEFSLCTAKLLLECVPASPSLAVYARGILDNILDEDDELIEAWFVLGHVALATSPDPDLQTAFDAFDRAKRLMDDIKEGMLEEARWNGNCDADNFVFPLAEQYELVQEQLRLLVERGVDVPNNSSSANIEADEESWSTCDEDDDNAMEL
jgi:hypothetical protein